MKVRGKIRYKILIVVIPIMMIVAASIGVTAYFKAKDGITGVATQFLGFKIKDIQKDAERRNTMLESMGDAGLDLLSSTKYTVAEYAETVIDSDSGGFLAVNLDDGIDFMSYDEFPEKDEQKILSILQQKKEEENDILGWLEFNGTDGEMVGIFLYFFDWDDYFIILEKRSTFYSTVNEMLYWIMGIVFGSILFGTLFLLVFIRKLLEPVNSFVHTIQDITSDMDLTKRVKIYYKDEIGLLSYYFNDMITELERAYNQIKNYAYQTVLAKKKEERVRFIFQKYVPQEVINQVLNVQADNMLIGNRQQVSILFSDIRSFTTISESMEPEELVLSLNRYFNKMVSIIVDHHGVVDKFIGDAIMADYGAPLVREDDAEQAVESAILMMNALDEFNSEQEESGKINFNIGVGINTGEVIAGNIGSEQKVEYTVIGDTVNLASRLEGLTKKYKVGVIISEFTRDAIPGDRFYYRELDNVRVKGKQEPVKIFQPMYSEDAEPDLDYYRRYHAALSFYYRGDFKHGLSEFKRLQTEKPDDYLNELYIGRCEYLIQNPPKTWDGVETFTTK